LGPFVLVLAGALLRGPTVGRVRALGKRRKFLILRNFLFLATLAQLLITDGWFSLWLLQISAPCYPA
jgi:hypothetical protein